MAIAVSAANIVPISQQTGQNSGKIIFHKIANSDPNTLDDTYWRV
jgi:hypothetical protein